MPSQTLASLCVSEKFRLCSAEKLIKIIENFGTRCYIAPNSIFGGALPRFQRPQIPYSWPTHWPRPFCSANWLSESLESKSDVNSCPLYSGFVLEYYSMIFYCDLCCGLYCVADSSNRCPVHVLWSLYFNINDTIVRHFASTIDNIVIVSGPDELIDYDNAIVEVTHHLLLARVPILTLSLPAVFYAWKQLLLSVRLSHRSAVRLSVCHTGRSVKSGAS